MGRLRIPLRCVMLRFRQMFVPALKGKVFNCLLSGLMLGLLPGAGPAQVSTSMLTNVAQIRSLKAAESARALPVQLRGVVISEADPAGRAIILADETAGIYLLADSNLFAPYRRGDRLEVRGITDPGEFAPIVKATAAHKWGATHLPAPRVVSYPQLITGALDAQWIEISGVVRRYLAPDSNSSVWRILLAADGGVVPVRSTTPRDPLLQEDAEVRVQAICLYQFNQKRQVLTPVLQVPDGISIQVIKPAPSQPFAVPVRAADSLLQFAPDNPGSHRVRVKGVVTYAQPGALVWIRDHSSGLRVQARQEENLKAGDEIDVLGFPAYGSGVPVLEDAVFRKTGTTQPPAPVVLTNLNAAFDHEDDLIALEAQLTEIQPAMEGLVLTLNAHGTILKALLKSAPAPPLASDWLPGSKVRVAGICTVIHDDVRPMMGVWQPQAFQLLLRSAADLTILSRPPWWTPKRVIYGLISITIALLLATGLLTLMTRRRLQEQALRRAMAEAEFTAILAERNRVAREIHDTLAQGLAATSVQLRLAKKQTAGDATALDHHIDVAQQLVRESLEEARNSIWNMRSQILETGDLPSALSGILKQMADGTELQTSVDITGRVRRFAPVIENNLLRVGQEAITNATKHAKAKQIKVKLDFGDKEFRLQVWDDGQGFDPAQPPPRSGGFGLVGMRERAAELKGKLNIHSAVGQGTEIVLTVPLSGE